MGGLASASVSTTRDQTRQRLKEKYKCEILQVKPVVNRCLSVGFLTGPLGGPVESPCSVLLCSVADDPDVKTPERQRPTLRGSRADRGGTVPVSPDGKLNMTG